MFRPEPFFDLISSHTHTHTHTHTPAHAVSFIYKDQYRMYVDLHVK